MSSVHDPKPDTYADALALAARLGETRPEPIAKLGAFIAVVGLPAIEILLGEIEALHATPEASITTARQRAAYWRSDGGRRTRGGSLFALLNFHGIKVRRAAWHVAPVRVAIVEAAQGSPMVPQPMVPQATAPVKAQPVKAQPVQQQQAAPVKAQPVKAQPVKAQPVKAQPVQQRQAAPVKAQRVKAQPVKAQPVQPVQPIASASTRVAAAGAVFRRRRAP